MDALPAPRLMIQALIGQLDMFTGGVVPASSAEETRTAVAPPPGSPRQWIERTEAGLCGVCGVNARATQPDAHRTILQTTSDQYCRGCFQAAVQALEKRGITKPQEESNL